MNLPLEFDELFELELEERLDELFELEFDELFELEFEELLLLEFDELFELEFEDEFDLELPATRMRGVVSVTAPLAASNAIAWGARTSASGAGAA